MVSNAPPFDPLAANDAEETEILCGYIAAGKGKELPADASPAFEHGWRCRRNDMAGVADDDQRKLARRLAENQARAATTRSDAEERRKKLRAGLRGPAARYEP